MIIVKDLLGLPSFENFKLISCKAGLNNHVVGTGIYEWESIYDIEKNFLSGEFVITTLSQSRGDSQKAEIGIKALIDKGVSGIGVKTVYFESIPKEIINYSDKKGVPIFLFSETYFDDIIFEVKNLLLFNEEQALQEENLKEIYLNDYDTEVLEEKLFKVNPNLLPNSYCIFINDKKQGGIRPETEAIIKKAIVEAHNKGDVIINLSKLYGGLHLIYTQVETAFSFDYFLKDLEDKLKDYTQELAIGVSNHHKSIKSIGKGIKESIFANASCIIGDTRIMKFQETGLDQVIFPNCDNIWFKNYYVPLIQKLEEYDKRNNSELLKTLLIYVDCKGDIKRVGDRTYQHPNTIRYRIGKIAQILNIANNSDYNHQLYFFARLHKIDGILKRYR